MPRSSLQCDGSPRSPNSCARPMARQSVAQRCIEQGRSRGSAGERRCAGRVREGRLAAGRPTARQAGYAAGRGKHRPFADVVGAQSSPPSRAPPVPCPAPCTPDLLCYMNASLAAPWCANSACPRPQTPPERFHVQTPSSPASPPRPPAICISAARARRCSTGSMRATPAARCCCASRTPTASARPMRRPPPSSTG